MSERGLIVSYTINITTAIIAVVMLFFCTSCGEKKKEFISIEYDAERVPSMITDSVVTFISDSGGVMRYKLEADIWEVYDKAKDPYWFFPKGIYFERFDDQLNIEAIVKADSAWNYTNQRLWKLKGNVDVRNMQGERFLSEELFWDQKNQKVYSEKYIEIKRMQRGEEELRGYGFESNEQMTDYRVFRPFDGIKQIRDNAEVAAPNIEEPSPAPEDSLTIENN